MVVSVSWRCLRADLGEYSQNVVNSGRWQKFCGDLGFIPIEQIFFVPIPIKRTQPTGHASKPHRKGGSHEPPHDEAQVGALRQRGCQAVRVSAVTTH